VWEIVCAPLSALQASLAGPRDGPTNACAALRVTVEKQLVIVKVVVRLLDHGLNALLHRFLELLVQRGIE